MKPKRNRRLCIHYIIGVDLGIAMQPTAIAVVEQETIDMLGKNVELRAMRLRHLERLPLDAPYHAVIERVKERLEALKELEDDRAGWTSKPKSDVIADITGTGRATGELMRKAGAEPIFVTITAGSCEVQVNYGDWRIGKADLVGGLKVLFENPDARFQVAKDIPLVPKFVEELQTFKLKPPTLNPHDPESWRERPDDDLVFAVALAAWRGRRYLPKPPATRERENRAMEKYAKECDRAVV